MKAFLLMIFLAIPFGVCAEEKIFLYGDYYSGMSREEFFKKGPAICDEYPDGEMICNRQRIPFAGLEWTQFFEFKKNGLSCVAFGNPASKSVIDHLIAWLYKANYAPISVEAGNASVDYINLYGKEEEFKKEAERFDAELPSAPRMEAYLVKRPLLDEYKTTDALPRDAILVTMGGTRETGAFFLCFELASEARPRFGR